MGACWSDMGEECTGDITTDVTRYLLFQLPAPGAPTTSRCGPGEAQRALCPPFHRYRNGTEVGVDDARFPFRAYHSVSTRERGPDGAFHCKHDCWCVCGRRACGWRVCRSSPAHAVGAGRVVRGCAVLTLLLPLSRSNPCDQDWLRIEPSPEWAEYGFPASVDEAMTPHKWTLDVGAVTGMLSAHFSGLTPPILEWTTLNVGPEQQGAPGKIAIWELADSDVLIEEGSQDVRPPRVTAAHRR